MARLAAVEPSAMHVFERYRFAGTVFVCALAAFAALLALHAYTNTFLDLRAFYCAGTAFAHGEDPYRNAALRTCEAALGTNVFAGRGFDQPTVPVPWTPYALPLLALLSSLPFDGAVVVWTVLNFGCAAVAAALLRSSLPELSPVAVATFVLFATVPTEAALGQPAGLELLAVAAAGVYARRGATSGTCIALLVAAIQPYVALPLAVGLLCAGAAARRAVAVAALVVVAASLIVLRPLTFEYLTAVAPEHARANVFEVTQLSWTSLLAAAGLPADPARALGTVIYIVAIALGVWAGLRLASSTRKPEALPWIAALLGTLAAPYLHFQQLAGALPGALVVVATTPAATRVAAIGLFVPWIGLLLQAKYSYAFVPFAAPMAWRRRPPQRAAQLVLLAFVLFCVDLALAAFFREPLHNPTGYRNPPLGADALADNSWRAFIAVQWAALGTSSLPARAVSAISGLALACITIAAARAARAAARPADPAPAR
jgi:hypothetical protein